MPRPPDQPAERSADAPWQFRGFRSPNYTQVPDELFDELLARLSGAELKVLLYVIRRTFGFKRESDNISLGQMLNGLRGSDGRQLDRGVGLTKKTLLVALRSLEDRGVIITERRQSPEHGYEPTRYRINVLNPDSPDDDRDSGGPSSHDELAGPLGEKFPQGKSPNRPPPLGEKFHQARGGVFTPSPWCKNSPIQETVNRETEIGETGDSVGSTRFDRPRLNITTGSELFSKKNPHFVYVQSDISEAISPLENALPDGSGQGADAASEQPASQTKTRPDRGNRRADASSGTSEPSGSAAESPVAGRRAPLGDDRHRGATPAHRAARISRSAASNPPAVAAGGRAPATRGRPPKAPPQVAAYVEQLSGELHDDEHVRSNIGQAARLWHGAGLAEVDFLGLLLEARTRTKARGNIEKRAAGEAGEWGLTNRMPYFFACLRELLNEASPPAQP